MQDKRKGNLLFKRFVFVAVLGLVCINSLSTAKEENLNRNQSQYQSTVTNSYYNPGNKSTTVNETKSGNGTKLVTETSADKEIDPESDTRFLSESTVPEKKGTSSYNTESNCQERQDEYDVYEYSAYEDFYDDHEDDFDGEDDAESYYDEAWEDEEYD